MVFLLGGAFLGQILFNYSNLGIGITTIASGYLFSQIFNEKDFFEHKIWSKNSDKRTLNRDDAMREFKRRYTQEKQSKEEKREAKYQEWLKNRLNK